MNVSRIPARGGLIAAFAQQTRVTRLGGTDLPLSMMLPPALRAVHAEGGGTAAEFNAAVSRLQGAFEAFKAQHGGRYDNIEKEVDRINTLIASAQIGGGFSIEGGGRRKLSAEAIIDFRAALMGSPQAARTARTDVGPEGGYLVPPAVDQMIASLLIDISPMRSLATVVTVDAGDYEKIVNRRGSGAAWAGEQTERGETDTSLLGKISIPTPELYAIPQATMWALEDSSFNVEDWIQTDVADEFGLAEGAAFVTGNGVLKPRGFTTVDTSPAGDSTRAFGVVQHVVSGADGAFAASDPVDALHNLLTSVRPVYRVGDAVGWVMNSTTAGIVRKFKDGDGRYIWADSIVSGQPSQLLGYPVFEDENMPGISSGSLSVAFGNWRRFYTIVDKRGMTMIRDPYTRKGWVSFYISKRVGGDVIDSNAVKFLKFSAS